ncbi:HNH endonuclease [Helicovermis profundi]|uniref:Putative HNH nuclease YajD n=1 Tax=Helicovermis profundi TaxID=3065157 RepID=A0AAU9EH52_9FIRM|nr:hypothetical protein HLPR_11340 [Clostridia bacterium S502]
MSKKICLGKGCNNLVDRTEKYCLTCSKKRVIEKRENNRKYDHHNRDKKIKNFYHSKAWKKFREGILIRDNYLCQECLKENIITNAEIVHHIVEVREDFEKRFVYDNCFSVCKACHNRIHNKI